MDNVPKCILREVTKFDCNLLFEWANDKSTRENSFNSDEIKYDEHVNWFEQKLKAKDTYMYILEVNKQSVGLIRLEYLVDRDYLISFSISPRHRKKGYATILLKQIKDSKPSYNLIGKVKNKNTPSIKAFLKAGYIMKEEGEIKIFYSLYEE